MTLQANAIVTVAEAIGWLGDATHLTDLILEPLVDRASDLVERITNRHFVRRSGVTVYYNGNGNKYLRLFHYPVISVSSLYVDNDREFGSEDLWVEGDDFLVYKDDGLLAVWSSASSTHSQVIWPVGTMNIKLTLDYGYATIPDDVKQATLEIVQDLYCRRTDSRQVVSESILNYSVKYATTNVGPIPQTAYDTLMAYADPLGGYDLFQEA